MQQMRKSTKAMASSVTMGWEFFFILVWVSTLLLDFVFSPYACFKFQDVCYYLGSKTLNVFTCWLVRRMCVILKQT